MRDSQQGNFRSFEMFAGSEFKPPKLRAEPSTQIDKSEINYGADISTPIHMLENNEL